MFYVTKYIPTVYKNNKKIMILDFLIQKKKLECCCVVTD